jgi:MscS family membrane protein
MVAPALTFLLLFQSLGSLLTGGHASSATGTGATDPLKRTTPRSSVSTFLQACYQERYVAAARYLDLSEIPVKQRLAEGPELAKDLAELLDRDPQFEVGRLSDNPDGNSSEPRPRGRNLLVTLEINGSPISLELQRIAQNDTNVWLVSAESVAHIGELRALEDETPFEKKLPQILVKTRLIGTPVWAWIALIGLALILSLLSRLLSRIVLAIIVRVSKRVATPLHTARLEAFVGPLRLLLAVAVFRGLMELPDPAALLRDYLLRLLALAFALGSAALAMRIADLLSDHLLTRLNAKERALSYSVLPLGVRFVKICIFCMALLFILADWGYNTNAILAGVGVGGLAVALAAQKTLENLFGGISLITDRPVLVGETCRFGGQQGTVEDIGLRSTRVRTLDRTLVTIPNSSFSTMTLENLSRRERMWFHPALHLRRDTSPENIKAFMDALTGILTEHPMVDPTAVPVRFVQINDQAFDLEIFAYVLTPDSDEFLKVQTELLLKFVATSLRLGIEFAVPLAESITRFHPDGELRLKHLPPD